ncbi:MAG: hypothetical protein LUC43_02925 [Burkholderiales bacterium]|nr:hypothetical protein [Burkholderiales bacterium]
MKIAYKQQNGISYACVMQSVRINGVPRNRVVHYLGRVLDKDKGIYKNKERGIFRYEIETDQFSAVPEEIDVPKRVRDEESKKPILNFGDVFLIDEVVKSLELNQLFESFPTKSRDSIHALVLFYILTKLNNNCAESWLRGSFARILYPNADLRPVKVEELLDSVGVDEVHANFMKAYIGLIRNREVLNDVVSIGCLASPYSPHLPLNAIKIANGKINRQIRLFYMLNGKTHEPIYFKFVQGDALDPTNLTNRIENFASFGIKTDLLFLTGGQISFEELTHIYKHDIPFFTRCPNSTRFFGEFLEKHLEETETEENLRVRKGKFREGSLIYLKQFKATYSGIPLYCYLGLDKERQAAERQKLILEYEGEGSPREKSATTLSGKLSSTGAFIILSSVDIPTDTVMSIYFLRQELEKVLGVRFEFDPFTPLVVRSEATLKGYLLMLFIANIFIRQLQKKCDDLIWPLEKVLVELGNQKARVVNGVVVPDDPSSVQRTLYKRFGITVPKGIPLNE